MQWRRLRGYVLALARCSRPARRLAAPPAGQTCATTLTLHIVHFFSSRLATTQLAFPPAPSWNNTPSLQGLCGAGTRLRPSLPSLAQAQPLRHTCQASARAAMSSSPLQLAQQELTRPCYRHRSWLPCLRTALRLRKLRHAGDSKKLG